MKKFFDNILSSAEAAAFKTYWYKFKKMDIDAASNLGSNIARKFGKFSSTQKTAIRNIRMCFPNIGAAEEKELLDAMWDNLGRIAGELPHLGEFGYFQENSRVNIKNLDRLDAYLEPGKGAVFASGHFSNWEVMPAVIVQRGVDCEITYREMNNPEVDKIIRDARAAYGVTLFAPKGREGGMRLMRILARGGSIAMMNDQKYNMGINSPLFGHNCMTNDAAVRLAHRFKTPIQTMTVKRLGGANFEVDVQEPILLDYSAPLDTILQKEVDNINRFIEEKIREAPEQWFWVHKRWPKQAWIDAGVM
ncbi:lysophospholipid acyltransferase family protein [Pseudaquidulcibacter saccharophilus]|uniref:lysophospholipid acyltransferase family protein n=1 Tax=Pseudaquidulcibacter saccharophilus TaxID=2831900 RepID=UPI001EFF3D29|nr:lysophospholipid acyltransferase family protein [Pseudaquidulcibacter saccharophilus]